MITSMTTPDEEERLLELYHYDILDTAEESDYNDIVELASQICKVPMSLVSIVDSGRQWFKARKGLGVEETPREFSFCAHAIADDYKVFEIEDATKDDRFFDNPLVTGDPNIRFYAGVPLTTQKGHKLGTLCVLDSKPGQLNDEQHSALKVLANQIIKCAEQKLQNRYLQTYQKRLQQQAEMQNKILSIVAHDVRSPLVSLQGIVELSQENLLSEAHKSEMIEMWKKQMDNTMCLLSNLVEWGKVQAGSDVQNTVPVNLYDIVQDEFIKCGIAATEKGNKLQNSIDTKFLVYGNENVLRFIIRNTLTNANKFTENGSIDISATRSKNNVSIIVTDTGIGMSEQQVKNLLSGNHSMVGLGTRNEKGSGLGFMLIKDFVEMLDGQVTVDSALGKGTTVRMKLVS
jgi:signal transduction histidine kinase